MRPFDPAAFLAARDAVLAGERETGGIGTLAEKTLHATLKAYLEPVPEFREQKLGRYVADIFNEEGIIEIQTRSLASLRPKLRAFCEVARVTLVHPVIRRKWVQWVDPEDGSLSEKHRSPKIGTYYDAFWELLFIRDCLTLPNLTFCFLLVDVEDLRFLDGYGKDRKRRSTRMDRIPVELVAQVTVQTPEDWRQFLPDLPEPVFTRKIFAKTIRQPLKRAGVVIQVLEAVSVLERAGNRGREYLYRVREPDENEGQNTDSNEQS